MNYTRYELARIAELLRRSRRSPIKERVTSIVLVIVSGSAAYFLLKGTIP